MQLSIIFLLALALYVSADCEPDTLYIQRHAERWYLTGDVDARGVLTQDGFDRSKELPDFMRRTGKTYDHIFVSQQIRDMQTGMYLMETGVPVSSYRMAPDNNQQIIDLIADLNPCPATIDVVYENDWLFELFDLWNYDSSILRSEFWEDQGFTLTVNVTARRVVDIEYYGSPDSTQNVRFRKDLVFPQNLRPPGGSGDCDPDRFYIVENSKDFHTKGVLTSDGFDRAKELGEWFRDTQSPLSYIFIARDSITSFQSSIYVEDVARVETGRYQINDGVQGIATNIKNINPCESPILIIIEEDWLDDLFDELEYRRPNDVDSSDVLYILENGSVETISLTGGFSPGQIPSQSSDSPEVQSSDSSEVDCSDEELCSCIESNCPGWGWSKSRRKCKKGDSTSTRELRAGGCL